MHCVQLPGCNVQHSQGGDVQEAREALCHQCAQELDSCHFQKWLGTWALWFIWNLRSDRIWPCRRVWIWESLIAFTYRRRKTLVGTMDQPARGCLHTSTPETWVSTTFVIRGFLKRLLPSKTGEKDVQSSIVRRSCTLRLSLTITLQQAALNYPGGTSVG